MQAMQFIRVGSAMLPLAQLELIRAGRRKGLYAARVLVPAGSFVLLALLSYWLPMVTHPELAEVGMGSEWLGRALTVAVFVFQLAVVIVMAPVLAAGTVAQEKHDRTLSLLLLADLRGFDIVFSKWLSIVLQTVLFLLSTLPVLAIASFFGGVPVPAMVLQVVLMISGAATLAAIGVLMSTLSRRPGEALIATVMVLAPYSVAIRVIAAQWWQGHQLDIFTAAYQAESLYLLGPVGWMPPMLLAMAVSGASLAGAGWLLPSRVFETARGRRPDRTRNILERPLRLVRRKGVPANPIAVIVRRCGVGIASSVSPAILSIIALLLAIGSLVICPIAAPLIVAFIAYDIASLPAIFGNTGPWTILH